jgi:hypothetical protein
LLLLPTTPTDSERALLNIDLGNAALAAQDLQGAARSGAVIVRCWQSSAQGPVSIN